MLQHTNYIAVMLQHTNYIAVMLQHTYYIAVILREFSSSGVLHYVAGWVVSVVPKDRGAFTIRGSQFKQLLSDGWWGSTGLPNIKKYPRTWRQITEFSLSVGTQKRYIEMRVNGQYEQVSFHEPCPLSVNVSVLTVNWNYVILLSISTRIFFFLGHIFVSCFCLFSFQVQHSMFHCQANNAYASTFLMFIVYICSS